MLIAKKTIAKFGLIEERYSKLRFKKLMDVPAVIWETYERYNKEPDEAEVAVWQEIKAGDKWGNDGLTAWFKADVTLPKADSSKVFIRAKVNGEALLMVNGSYKGVFDVNHPVVMMTSDAREGSKYHFTLEAYSGHHMPGCGADENDPAPTKGCKTYDGIEIVTEREDVTEFVFDFRALRQLVEVMDEHSLRANKIANGLVKVFAIVDALPSENPEESWRPKLAEAKKIIKPLLSAVNGSTAPYFGIIGHSHIDTAWLWPIAETKRKCARTFSSVLNLMEQYPEFIFVQSTPYHTSIIKERYPEIYGRIEKKVKEGKWEPNGAMWVEPDCNVPSGESFVRQLLVGQNATRETFGYTADTLWLPDVFGYSAALPQILQGAGVKYFCTTKLDWNDTNRFPYDTFVWKGIDGTSVISHFHNLHCEPDPKTLDTQWKHIQHKDVQDRRLIAIGYGDGGGGPTNEMIEISRRVKNLEGCPKAEYTTVSDFMKGIERDLLGELPTWVGELYLELHRGTLTSIADVKRSNRKCEFAIRDAEFAATLAKLKGAQYPKTELDAFWKEFLVNQFHDILPGSSIARVNDEAKESLARCLTLAENIKNKALGKAVGQGAIDDKTIFVLNNLSWTRSGECVLDEVPQGYYPEDKNILSQWISDVNDTKKLVISGADIKSFGWKILHLTKNHQDSESPFNINGSVIDTPHCIARLDSIGRIVSLFDKTSKREVVKVNGAINTLYLGEDVPGYWDNWDIDRDQMLKMNVENGFISSEVMSNGPLQLRIRSKYKIGVNSEMIQDMVFHASSPQIDFETKIEWKEKHKLLKAGFDLEVFTDTARQEIQYGYVERATHENLSQDRARFETCNHKWTDLSESEFGVAILNDCKYGISVRGSSARLSLMKSGLRPDPRGDEGTHYFTYAVLPHACGFSVEAVVRPAYELNVPVIAGKVDNNVKDYDGLIEVDSSNVIVESVKWAENGNGMIVRVYEAGKAGKHVKIKFNLPIKAVRETNLLEEDISRLQVIDSTISGYIKPFEIKTYFVELA